jgi:hypothetical protein
MSAPMSNADDIRAALSLFLTPGTVIEIRVPNVGGKRRTDAGYFDDLDAAVAAAVEYAGTAPAVYVTLNPCNPALLARAKNRMEEFAGATTADPDIVRRRWLLIDCDPVRPSGISSTSSEELASIAMAHEIQDYLITEGFPKGIIGSSGNGGHLLYRIDLPNDAESLAVVKQCLEALAAKFNTPKVKIDTGVGNAARITKLYGTIVCKGDDTPERPHRVSRLFSTEPPAVVSREALDTLAAMAPAKRELTGPRRLMSGASFDIDAFIERHQLDLREPKDWQGGRLWVFNTCPFDGSHEQNGATQLIQMESGAIVASCHHERCKGKTWADLRRMLEPTPPTIRSAPVAEPEPGNLADGVRAVSLLGLEAESVEWLWHRYVPAGMLTLVAGDPDQGKSLLTHDLVARLTTGKPWPDGAPGGEPADVALLASEDSLTQTILPRLSAAGADFAHIRQIKSVVVAGQDQHFSLVRDLQALDAEYARRPFKALVVDPINAYLPDVDTYRDNDVRVVLTPLTQWAERRAVAVVAIIHNGKNADRNALQRMLGSIAFSAAARACYLVCRDAETDGQQLFLCSKLNIGQKPPGLAYRFQPRTVPGKGGALIESVGVAWEPGTVKVTADEALRGLSKTGPQARQEATKAIRAVLASGPVEATEAVAQVRAAGVSMSTLTRAKLDLEVKSAKVGGFNDDGLWYWLPLDWTPEQIREWKIGAFAERAAAKLLKPPV